MLYSRPAIDVLFESAADAYRETLIGIVLTGANADGSQGLKAVVDAGGAAFVQTPNTAYAAAMPQAALRSCPSADALDLTRLSDFLKTMVI